MPDPSAVQRGFEEAVRELRNDLSLTDGERRRRIARAWVDATTALRRMRADVVDADEASLQATRRRLIASPTNPAASMSYLVALDRVAQCEDEADAMTLLVRSDAIGDRLLERACVAIALERRWDTVLNAYADEHPDATAGIQQLIAAQNRATRDGLQARITGEMTFGVGTPTELAGMNEWAINDLAEAVA